MKPLHFISIVTISGLPLWLINYHTYTSNHNYTYLSFFLLVLTISFIFFKFDYKFWNVFMMSLLAHQLALIVKVVIDIFENSTNHNLLPFEMIIYLFFDVLVLISVLLIVSKIKHYHLNKNQKN
ncbi:MAG: hypothetical protein RLY15_1633 [Bacteroidota bacterium]|jgi:hypothetical protein